MAKPTAQSKRRNTMIAAGVAVIIIIALLLLLRRCQPAPPPVTNPPQPSTPSASDRPSEPAAPADPVVDEPEPPEDLSPATVRVPERIGAGAAFTVEWVGPNNRGDYVTIVRPDATPDVLGDYAETEDGPALEITAPIEPGEYEVRYVTDRTRTILGRAPIVVEVTQATIRGPEQVVMGSEFEVEWTGPDNEGDFVTIVAQDAPDDAYASYADTEDGSPATLTAPIEPGTAELRYVSGQGRVVLARRPIRIVEAEVSVTAPDRAIAGSSVEVVWTGPDNIGDYITVVPAGTPDGRYDNYTNTSQGSPLELLMPIMEGPAEIRYMTGQGHRVLARRPIAIVAAEVTLSGPESCAPGAEVEITWTGPNHPGDYITIVERSAADGRYGDYRNTTSGSPLRVRAPATLGDAEIRYMTGQDGKVLARRIIRVEQ